MKEKWSHTIIIGIIITVVGGVILTYWPTFRDALAKVFIWLWDMLIGAWNYLWSAHNVYGWVMLALVFLSIPTIISGINRLKKRKEPGYTELYREDDLFGAKWHWNYANGSITNLSPFCPQCQTELVYSVFIPRHSRYEDQGKSPRTEIICERCNDTKVFLDGIKSYALGTVEREIERKIRTHEWQNSVQRTT